MTAHMKWFDLQAEPVEKPEGGWVNYPSQVCIDTNPKFRHLLSAQELVILQQAARVKELEEALNKTAFALESVANMDGNKEIEKYARYARAALRDEA